MADVNATDLTQETYSTLDGTEQFIMFDSAEGKRATVAAVGEYVLKKLTTSLNGSTQTVANALSSLNSDVKKIQHGSTSSITVSAGSYGDIDVTFPTAFTSTPTILVTIGTSSTGAGMGNVSVAAFNKSKTGFTIRCYNNDTSSRTPGFTWVAVL